MDMRKRNRTGWLAGLAAALWVPVAANASLLGDDITIEWHFPNPDNVIATETVTVGPGHEVDCPGPSPLCLFAADSAFFDIGAETINWTGINHSFFTPANFNGFVFSDLDWVNGPGEIIGFILDTNMENVDDSRVSFTTDSISINLESGDVNQLNATDFFTLRLLTRHVPEPGTALLLGLGLAGIALQGRRKRP